VRSILRTMVGEKRHSTHYPRILISGRLVGISGQSLPIFAPLLMIDVLRGDVDTMYEGRFSMSYDSFCRTFRTA